MPEIRVGMIGANLHALYYGVQMFKYDPLMLRDRGGGYNALCYHYTHCADPTVMTSPFVGGFTLASVWDADSAAATTMADCFDDDVRICDSPDICSEDVDLVFIADCDGDGTNHLELSTPGLERGIPTFVDTPFARAVTDAATMIKLAKKYDTPIMSLSMLNAVPQAIEFRNRLAEVGPEVGFGTVKGDMIPGIALALSIFGGDVHAVHSTGQEVPEHIHIDYIGAEGRPVDGVIINAKSGPSWHNALYASAYGASGAIHSGPIGDFEFPWGSARILEMVTAMVETGQPQISYDLMMEHVAVAQAARFSQDTGRRVHIREILIDTY